MDIMTNQRIILAKPCGTNVYSAIQNMFLGSYEHLHHENNFLVQNNIQDALAFRKFA